MLQDLLWCNQHLSLSRQILWRDLRPAQRLLLCSLCLYALLFFIHFPLTQLVKADDCPPPCLFLLKGRFFPTIWPVWLKGLTVVGATLNKTELNSDCIDLLDLSWAPHSQQLTDMYTADVCTAYRCPNHEKATCKWLIGCYLHRVFLLDLTTQSFFLVQVSFITHTHLYTWFFLCLSAFLLNMHTLILWWSASRSTRILWHIS